MPIRYKSRDVGDEHRHVGDQCRDVGDEHRHVGDQCLCCGHHSFSKTYQSTLF
ncbi:hypothetical protein HCG51_23820 [Tolypothrix sp. PCC 7910]|uniref:hypothetical protein n=1 Tax=Tolypothrix sp. PCC 7910 TaxID=2099387 RepID=UPI0014279406|nr:hypothetical protein [Tolypothrix sp. PCC 7910]QIR39429.1 hypothetical protein HCG51_23820 [Tolypothrix sp. PCC 7910]